MHQPRLLFLDAYDSFSNNIIALLHDVLQASITAIKIDDPRFLQNRPVFHAFLQTFDAVVAGPGPGNPRNPADVGLIEELWGQPEKSLSPVLGICLGFQSLAIAFGARVEQLLEPRHGFVTPITHRGRSLFQDAGIVEATQYHSLHVRLSQDQQVSEDLWRPTQSCPCLEPLAWDLSDPANGPVLMAMKHVEKPFCGVQYHPESICTNGEASRVIRNWWTEASARLLNRAVSAKLRPGVFGEMALSSDSGYNSASSRSSFEAQGCPAVRISASFSGLGTEDDIGDDVASDVGLPLVVHWKCADTSANMEAADILNLLQDVSSNTVLLESGTRNGESVQPDTGRFSIMACMGERTPDLRYYTNRNWLESTLSTNSKSCTGTMTDVWTEMEDFVAAHCAVDGPVDVPFWGGLVGFISYEAGLETIDVAPPTKGETRPDVWFRYVDRSVVIDHWEKRFYVQSIKKDDSRWVNESEQLLRGLFESATRKQMVNVKGAAKDRSTAFDAGKEHPETSGPLPLEYCDKVRLCQSYIRAGSSYELCLTDQSLLRFPPQSHSPSPWQLYQRLRCLNPAPFGAYLRFRNEERGQQEDDEVTILSSSPERFLSWSRSGRCQFRPIKGTVKKSGDMSREKAEAILSSKKERAENLMIVDLIRHDLHGVVGSGNVEVEKLMTIEEYETVFQLVSVIEGKLPEGGTSPGLRY
ncbi:para-aminobenzoate synthase, (PABA) [Taxawa tesnikishii (nom. ined.)]|nr:para-aminobenzoate synthase, (PABA) [Dothideales sp. JES 119]